MKKIITIVCEVDVPINSLLNHEHYDIYEAKGEDSIFTFVKKEKEEK